MGIILDITRMLTGPFATMLLADLGLEVVKVEERRLGDPTRRNPPYKNGVSAYFFSANRNKSSMIIDLKNPEGRRVFLDLVRQADAVIENFRPGVMEGLGLSYDELRAVNPRVVLVSIHGFGSYGPLRNKIAFDVVTQAMAGAMALTTPDDGEPIKPALPISDLGAGTYAALALLRGLLERQQTGSGQHLEVSLFDATLALSAHVGEQFLMLGEETNRPVRPAPDNVYATADGHIALSAYSDTAWTTLCTALGQPQWQHDPRCNSLAARSIGADVMDALLAPVLAGETSAHWLSLLTSAGIPAASVANTAQVLANTELQERGMLPVLEHPITGPLQTIGCPIQRLGQPYRTGVSSPPRHGEHTEVVLREKLGYSDSQISALMESGAVHGLVLEE